VRFRVLGDVEARVDGNVVDLGPARQRCVLAALLVDVNRVVSADQLAERVWADQRPHRAHRTLSSYLSRLRRILPDVEIIHRSGGYVLQADPDLVDLHRFRALVADANSLTAYDEALALWRGEAFAGLDTPWFDAMRVTVDRELFEAELGRADVLLAQGEQERELGALIARAEANPLHERAAGQLILALYRGGRQADALDWYQRTRMRLADEYGVDPGPALRELHQQILSEDESLRGAGKARPVPRQLPAPPPCFIGRQEELAELTDALDARARAGGVVGISAIDGTAGVGKTWLALHWAHRNVDQFPDGQLHVNLRGFDPQHEPVSPRVALRGFLDALGADPRSVPEDEEGQAALYRTMVADKRMLFVFDNARDAGQIELLLPGNTTSTVLVTSRNRLTGLRVRGARVLDLGMLDNAEARELLAWHLGAERVAADPAAVDRLVMRCAGLPLALSIVAARAAEHPHIPLEVFAKELADTSARLDALNSADLTTNLRAVFSWSYRALDTVTARVFRLLGVVPGPDFTRSTVVALAGDTAAGQLGALVAANLVEHHEPGRYRFHDLVRLYAAEQAQADPERDEAWARLVQHYASVACALVSRIEPSPIPLDWCHVDGQAEEATAVEIPNLLAALPPAATRGPHPAAWQLVADLRTFCHDRVHRYEWLTVAPTVLDAARAHGEQRVQAMLHHSIGDFHIHTGQRDAGLHHLSEAVRIAHECGWRACEALALADLGAAWEWTGPLAEAVRHTRQAVALFGELGDTAVGNHTLNSLGRQYHLLGELRDAEESFQRALALSERLGLPHRQANDLTDLGSVRRELGSAAEAAELLNRGLQLFRTLGSETGQVRPHIWLSRLHWENGDHLTAHSHGQRALELARDNGARLLEGAALITLADAETGLEEFAEAEKHLAQAREFIDESGFDWHRAEMLIVSARLSARTGQYPAALRDVSEALLLTQRNGFRLVEVSAQLQLTEVHVLGGQTQKAFEEGHQALAMCAQMGHVLGAAHARRLLSTLA
jgi:DNA-binding SARP family transcriptional activator